MKLYSQQAVTLLHAKAKSISAQPNSWRVIYLDFTSQRDAYSDGVRSYVVTNILKDLLEGEDGYVYLCEDGDVFILFQGKVSDIMNRLGEHFQGLASDQKAADGQEAICTVFDLSMQWDTFFTLCEKKVAQLEEEAAKAIAVAPAPAQKALRDADIDLFQAAASKRAARKRLQVLVVEDDPFTRRLVVGVLKVNYDVLEAEDGESALRAFESNAPDLVFLDIELPDTNGHVVLSKLLTCDKSAFIVMLSANSMKENILAALEKGAQGFVTKPFAKEKLMHYLRLRESTRLGSTRVS